MEFSRDQVLHAKFRDELAEIFKRIIPPDNRGWMWDCMKIETHRRPDNYAYEFRVLFRPGTYVVPKDSLSLSFMVDDHTTEYMLNGQADMVNDYAIEDFIIKLMMVYSRTEQDF